MGWKRKKNGFSFIEVMIVVVIIGLMMAGVGLSIGATSRVKLRSSCWTLMAAIRYAYSRAVTQGTTTRLVLDFDSRSMHIDETKGRVVLNREDETGEGVKRSESEEKGDDSQKKGDNFLNLSDTPSSGLCVACGCINSLPQRALYCSLGGPAQWSSVSPTDVG